ncbi:hypothetical protein THASP1DRAFT_23173 [Thamnocephalis sphaerospora]|uniref:Bms1-type G domain-containing protein n=1 Tax=Thamnocephalis sphaerospora TaxID=78915 RepID=A0A4P9XTN9_9FUNG|nr:hypothetical protein THASP1DRAFT_23173 [Thamnocephalis sphaerospora]|eukprot:RKP08921.1 hypothetical protein THASP1DRAFT_23173 [Thamnocephalis sphaerospora]
MVADKPFHHRASLKQANKPFKSRHASKGTLRERSKGRVHRQSVKGAAMRKQSRQDRRNTAQLDQKKKRETLLALNRLFTGRNGVPKIVAVIPLCPDVSATRFVQMLYKCEGLAAPMGDELVGSYRLVSERQKQSLQLLLPRRNFTDILDAAKVADFCVFLLSAEQEVDKFGELCLRAIQAQGLPSIVSLVQHLENVAVKKRNDVKKSLVSFMSYFFPDQERVLPIDTDAEMQVVLRTLTGQLPRVIKWRNVHPYMLVDQVDFMPSAENPEVGSLRVTGYARGAHFNANRLVHLPNYGNFQLEQILASPLAPATSSAAARSDTAMELQPEMSVLQIPDPEKRESLKSENDPDLLANEQTWPTEEELQEADERVRKMQREEADDDKKRRVPKGTSAYQAAWIVDSDNEDGSDGYEDVDDSDDDAMHGCSDEELGSDGSDAGETMHDSDNEAVAHGEEYEEVELESRGDQGDFVELSPEEEDRQLKEYLKRQREHQDELDFPDEVDTPLNMSARVRFQRYRGLKNFRRTFWDPYENLPLDYARIFRFADYKRTRGRVIADAHVDGVQTGMRITLQLAAVPRAAAASYDPTRPFIVYGLLQHENKMSVVNFTVTRDSEYTEPVRSKDTLVLHCGFRRFRVQPLYSQNTPRGKGSNNVHKFERFLHNDQTSVATIFAPIQFGQMPVSLYRETDNSNEPILVATGTFLDAEPNRIIAKRIVLSGHPAKVHKKSAVIRYMFFHPDDVHWFKPVQLHTKYGRQGHIKESLGTHGYMKCMFDGPLKHQDTILMNLYKRVFPKWTTELWRDTSGGRAFTNDGQADMDM